MNKVYDDHSFTIGNTPLVRLNRVSEGKVLAKVESRNPSFSVKCLIGAGFVPQNLDLNLIDRVELVESDEAIEMARRLMKEEGILAGISSGAAVIAANCMSKLEEFEGKTIVTVLPSSGERYLSSTLFSGVFSEKEIRQ